MRRHDTTYQLPPEANTPAILTQVPKKNYSTTRRVYRSNLCGLPCPLLYLGRISKNCNTDLRSQFGRTGVCCNSCLSLYLPVHPDLPPVDSCHKNTRGQCVDETRTVDTPHLTSRVTGEDRKTTNEQAAGENPPLYLLPLPLSFPICLH